MPAAILTLHAGGFGTNGDLLSTRLNPDASLVVGPRWCGAPETVIDAMLGSAKPTKLEELRRVDRIDFAMAIVTLFVVLALDLLPAMVSGIAMSIIYMVYRVSFLGRELLGRVPETGGFEIKYWLYGHRSGRAHAEAEAVPGVLVYRSSAPLNFSNANAFTGTGKDILIDAEAKDLLPHTVVIDCEEMFRIDDTGTDAITDLFEYAQRYGVDLVLCRVHSGTRERLRLTGVIDTLGEHRTFDTVRNAVAAASEDSS